MISDPRLRKLSFTGSTEVGRTLIEQSAENILKVSMELGGNAPFLVFEDADLDAAVEGAMIAKMRNIGEACTAANRFHVAGSIADEFTDRLAERMGSAPRRPRHGGGRGRRARSSTTTSAARSPSWSTTPSGKGAKVLVGGSEADGAGYFYEPTVLGNVPPDARLLQGGDLRPRRAGGLVRLRRRRRSPRPTTPSTGSSPTSSPAT